eukprot:CAMPEP_0172616228 /NCGR_PEP_ID=MMETSP1068-20121228/62787_1 /TAXON_ID=35684 /ORGANISM="Pseudopedinella elastica, Strain CCMP716" /LENGTH=512 /DNA_ID=CAMNT_0013421589 /DNA_START=35 /DNA_END=1573 /DNA_ORIENTATION=-
MAAPGRLDLMATRRLEDVASLAAFDTSLTAELNTMWLLIGAILVFFMQTGFAMLEAGSVATRITNTILLKNVMDASLGAVIFAAVGYGFAYGDTSGHGVGHRVIGKTLFFLEDKDFSDGTGYLWASWLFQWAFAATTATIVSGAVAERVTFGAYLCYSIVLITLVYPVVVCAMWSSEGWATSWRDGDKLFGCGAVDFAGSGVVHLTGGVAALVGASVLGPRRAFLVNEIEPPEYGPIFQTLGTLILWVGWYGFNGVSTLYIVGYAEVAAKTMVCTTISAALGALSTMAFYTAMEGKDHEGKYHLKLEYANNGLLAGLVAITASCSVVEPYGAALIGLLSGPVYVSASKFLLDLGIDDVVDAFPVHGACGAFGVIMAGVLATPHNYGNAYFEHLSEKCSGIAYGGDGSMLAANLVCVACIVAWSGSVSFAVFTGLNTLGLLRVSDAHEDAGMGLDDSPPSNPLAAPSISSGSSNAASAAQQSDAGALGDGSTSSNKGPKLKSPMPSPRGKVAK